MTVPFKFYALKVCGVVIIIYFFQLVFFNWFTSLFWLDQSSWIFSWKFVSSIFLHDPFDPSHIIFNLFGLALFGSILEKVISGRRFLEIFFVTGILANLIAINFYPRSLGASGAIFGIIGALVIVRPWLLIPLGGFPVPVIIATVFWGLRDLIGAYTFLVGTPINSTGSFAHLSGLIFGMIFGIFYRIISKGQFLK